MTFTAEQWKHLRQEEGELAVAVEDLAYKIGEENFPDISDSKFSEKMAKLVNSTEVALLLEKIRLLPKNFQPLHLQRETVVVFSKLLVSRLGSRVMQP
jgi:hypothetical protein